LEFHAVGGRDVLGGFDGGPISSDGGALLLSEVEEKTGIVHSFSELFTDHRDPEAIEHTVEELAKQRIFGLALGYEDLNDHDRLRYDPLLAAAVGKEDPSGASRVHERDRGKALASSSTLNRMELTLEEVAKEERYKKIAADTKAMDRFFVECFLQARDKPPETIWLDLDATDDPLHGAQEGRFFHGYYGNYCYLPLYIFCDEHLLCARLRQADIDASSGSVDELTRIVGQIRQCWPETRIIIRGDSGFCREEIMAWCESNDIDFVLGVAKNKRLLDACPIARIEAQRAFLRTLRPSRVFCEFQYKTLKTWSRERRVIAKAEHLRKGANPRFVVTSLSAEEADPRHLYEGLYCARGDMENRIKECQLELFADRTSTQSMRANQIRLYFSSVAYILMCALRRLALHDTELERAQPGTIRARLLKVGAHIRITVRKIWVTFSESFPAAELFRQALANIRATTPVAGAP
jgi:hypothetical protein